MTGPVGHRDPSLGPSLLDLLADLAHLRDCHLGVSLVVEVCYGQSP